MGGRGSFSGAGGGAGAGAGGGASLSPEQQAAAGNEVRWKKTRGEQMVGSFSKQAAVKKARKNK